MRKEDIRKAFADLAIHKPLKLRPPSGPIASQDKKTILGYRRIQGHDSIRGYFAIRGFGSIQGSETNPG